jgi:hypothetical protein
MGLHVTIHRVHCAGLSTSQYVVLRGGIFLASCAALSQEVADGKINVQSACAVNTRFFSWDGALFNRDTFTVPFEICSSS